MAVLGRAETLGRLADVADSGGSSASGEHIASQQIVN